MSGRRAFFVNSALAYATATLLMAAVHETGHGLMAQALGFSPKIYAFYEDNPSGTPHQNLLILAAGPLTSLIVGAILLVLLRRQRSHYAFDRLLLFWMSWASIMTFVNYLIVTPWLAAGDTAAIADILNAPVWARYVVCVIGIAIVIALARPAKRAMLAIAPAAAFDLQTFRGRRAFVLYGFYLPLFAGTALTALGGIGGNPFIVFLGLLGTIGNIDIIAATLYVDIVPDELRAADAPLRIAPAAIVAYVIMVAAYVFVFARGMPV